MLRSIPFSVLVSILLVGMLISACDQTLIDPFEQSEEKYFTVYGFLDELESNHSLRVIPVSRRPETIATPSDPGAEIDARVFTTEVFTGTRIEWKHALDQLDDGSYGHVFKASFNVKANQKYLLEIVREDGATTTAETTVPYFPGPSLYQISPAVVSPDSSVIYQDVYIPQISSPWGIQAVYGWVIETAGRRVYIDYGREGERTQDGGWRLRLNYTDDNDRVRADIQDAIDKRLIFPGETVWLGSAGFLVRILDQNWDPPEGVFDPEVLAQPGALSNVQNGYGLFGSVGVYIEEWSATDISPKLGYDK